MVSRFNDLPSEVQHLIFDKLICPFDRYLEFKEYVLVSKAWNSFFQAHLYKLLDFKSFSSFTKYFNAVQKNHHLGSLAIDIVFDFDIDSKDVQQNSSIAKVFTHLTKLEQIECVSGACFRLLADAMLMGYLKHLTFIEPPNDSSIMNDYVTCALISKTRLTNLKIMDSVDEDQYGRTLNPVQFNRLFNNLRQFDRVDYLQVEKKSDDIISLIEKISRVRPDLYELDLDVGPREHSEAERVDVTGVVKPNFVPQSNVRNLSFAQNILHDSQIVLYMIHKFPRVRSLHINGQLKRTARLNELALNKFLRYISSMTFIVVDSIPFMEKTVVDSIGSLWKNVSQFRTLEAEINYDNRSLFMDELGIELRHGPAMFKFSHASANTDLKHIGILIEHGQYIESSTLSGVGVIASQQLLNTTYVTLILQPLKYCANLKRLTLRSSVVAGSNMCSCGITSKKAFESLRLEGCIIKDDEFFKKLSTMFGSIKHLEFSEMTHAENFESRGIQIMNMDMSNTDVGTLVLSMGISFSVEGKRAIFVKLTIRKTSRYYKYHINASMKFAFKVIDEQMFYDETNHNECFLIGVHCKSLQNLQVKQMEKGFNLKIKETWFRK